MKIDRFDFQVPPNSIFHPEECRLNFTETHGTLISHDVTIDEFMDGKDLNVCMNGVFLLNLFTELANFFFV